MFIQHVMRGVIFGGTVLLMLSGSAYAKVQTVQLAIGAVVPKSAVKEVKSSNIKMARR